jgi:hypothetical protein
LLLLFFVVKTDIGRPTALVVWGSFNHRQNLFKDKIERTERKEKDSLKIGKIRKKFSPQKRNLWDTKKSVEKFNEFSFGKGVFRKL